MGGGSQAEKLAELIKLVTPSPKLLSKLNILTNVPYFAPFSSFDRLTD
jgi:hypothetical protein